MFGIDKRLQKDANKWNEQQYGSGESLVLSKVVYSEIVIKETGSISGGVENSWNAWLDNKVS